MSFSSELDKWYNDFKTAITPALTVAETDAKAIGNSALTYIKTNGLQDLYQIALTVVGAAAPGASWATTLASIEAQAIAAGKTLLSGATAVVAAQAQADLIAAGTLLPPVSTPPASAS
jgi:molybdopterin biosynthesis enzyme